LQRQAVADSVRFRQAERTTPTIREIKMHPVIRSAVAALAFSAGLACAQADKVVYHIDDAATQATKGLRNIRNHLDVAPDTQIVVVTHANGVDFLMDGAKDPKNPSVDYGALVSALKARKVRFEVCEITLKNRKLKRDQFSMDADFTPSGVVRLGRLQAREGFAYIKP
jgi:intracellular sulfur oxidation DsrE/DsrF family protein